MIRSEGMFLHVVDYMLWATLVALATLNQHQFRLVFESGDRKFQKIGFGLIIEMIQRSPSPATTHFDISITSYRQKPRTSSALIIHQLFQVNNPSILFSSPLPLSYQTDLLAQDAQSPHNRRHPWPWRLPGKRLRIPTFQYSLRNHALSS